MNVPFHVGFLKDELVRRQSKNSRYSLRAFAHHLEIHPSALSRILAHKQEISLKCTVVISSVIVFTDEDKIKFLVSVSEERMHKAAEYLTKACNVVLPITRGNQWVADSENSSAS